MVTVVSWTLHLPSVFTFILAKVHSKEQSQDSNQCVSSKVLAQPQQFTFHRYRERYSVCKEWSQQIRDRWRGRGEVKDAIREGVMIVLTLPEDRIHISEKQRQLTHKT